MNSIYRHRTILLLFIFSNFLAAQGSVYLVLGSDTAIWDGLDVNKYHCTYNFSLYDAPGQNAYTVMDPAFRMQFKDSYGTTMKLTWWMMAGNVYRYATNNNVPVPNVMTLYLMKKYHGENVKILGDELTLHYHTFTWTDYNQDGAFYWNQAKTFPEYREDFDVTMAQFLLEENVFPVSFRTGWHFMDDAWQNYIDGVIPYSLHNDYPSKRTSVTEPIDNVFDWSRASKEYVPFHPSLSDYQVPGNGKSWNTRSYYMGRMNQAEMDSIFARASRGIDQVPCLWAHLPEADFPQNLKKIDSLAHVSALKYPTVKFSYCTAVEAMQKWRKGTDTIPPVVTMTEVPSGDRVKFAIQTNEQIYQTIPYVAIKDIYDRYTIMKCTNAGVNQWITDSALIRTDIVKAGVAVTDTMGNLATTFLNILPDDIFIDNREAGYHEIKGLWTSSTNRSWGTDSRQSVINAGDTAIVEWSTTVQQSRPYSIFFQVPSNNTMPESLWFRIMAGGIQTDSAVVAGPFLGNEWIYIATVPLTQDINTTIQMIARGNSFTGSTMIADVIKLTPVVKEREIYTRETLIRPASISEDDSTIFMLKIENHGVSDLTISDIHSANNIVGINFTSQLVMPGMSTITLPLILYSNTTGVLHDTIIILSNDVKTPVYAISVQVTVEPYFKIVDNDDVQHYSETGPWSKSVAQRWGVSSRYAYSGSGAYATFTEVLKKTGNYEIFEIVPTTVNAVTNALYIIHTDTDTIGSIVVDQNIGSGNWVSIGTYPVMANIPAHVTVKDQGPAANVVLRADAVKFQIVKPVSVHIQPARNATEFSLDQNYPNPFNPSTILKYSIPERSTVRLSIFNTLGQNISDIVNEIKDAGSYERTFTAHQTTGGRVTHLSSGIYFYRIEATSEVNPGKIFVETKKMILMK